MVTFIADADPTPWPKGGAGHAPAGNQMFSVTIEPHVLRGSADPPGIWTFYNYWHEMQGGWGNYFYDSFDQIDPGRWYCVEVMVKANSSPEQSDGMQAFWIDDRLKGWPDTKKAAAITSDSRLQSLLNSRLRSGLENNFS